MKTTVSIKQTRILIFWLYDNITDEIQLLDADGKSKLVFGIASGNVYILRNYNVKTLKNLFTEYEKDLMLEDLRITRIEQNIKSIDNLRIIDCKRLTDMSTIQKVDVMYISNCKKFTKMKNLPKVISELRVHDMTLNTSKNDKIQISKLILKNVFGIKNFLYLPTNIKVLHLEGKNTIESFVGIDYLDTLTKMSIAELRSYNSMITVLLCESLSRLIIFSRDERVKIIEKYMEIPLSTRRDHIMDCAVELIDAGFPDVAEL